MKYFNGTIGKIVLASIMLLVACFAVFELSLKKSEAAINPLLNFTGKVTDTGGTAVTDNVYNFNFGLYTTATSGAAVWSENLTAANMFAGTISGVSSGATSVTYTYNADSNDTTLRIGQYLTNATTGEYELITDYDAANNTVSVATTTAWSATETINNRPRTEGGVVNIDMGAVSDLSAINFNQVLYLEVTFNSETMQPRKVITPAAAAFNADKLDGYDASDFANPAANTVVTGEWSFNNILSIATSSANTALTVTQSGGGDIVNFFDGLTEVFTITDGGYVGIGTSTPYAKLSIWGTGNLLELVDTASTTVFAVDSSGNITQATWQGTDIAVAYGGTGTSTFQANSLVYASSDNVISEILPGLEGQVLLISGGKPSWASTAPAAAHSLLSVQHSDTTPAAVQRGDIITGQGASPAWSRLALGANGYVLYSDGTDAAWNSYGNLWASQMAATTTNALAEGINNLYWTNSRFDTRFAGNLAATTTSALAEGTNLYWTNARFDTRFAGNLAATTTTALAEGTNLYYTDDRARLSISETVTGLDYNNTTGVFSIASGYGISLTASTTNWNGFYDTPSTVITAGNYIDWSGNTLNVVGTLPVSIGGIGTSTFQQNSLVYASADNVIGEVLAGANNYVLKSVNGLPTWVATSSLGIDFGDIGGIVPTTQGGTGADSSGWSDGIVQITGGTWSASTTLSAPFGGTGKTSWTQYAIPYLTDSTTFGEIGIGGANYLLAVNAGGNGYAWVEAGSVGVDTKLTQEEVEDYAGALIASSSGAHTRITVAYDDADGSIDFTVDNNLHNYSWANVTAADMNFGTHFYTYFNATTTDALAEGSNNLYYTDARAIGALGQLGQIGDVSTTSLATYDILYYDGSNWVPTATSTWASSGAYALNDLTDVNAAAAYGNLLWYNGSSWDDIATSALGIAITDTTGILTAARGGTGQNFSASTGFMYLSNGVASASSTIHIGNTDLIAGTGLTLTSNTLNLDEFTMGTTDTNATAGSVFFAGAGGVLQQDNGNFFWDDTNNRLGIGTTTPNWNLQVAGTRPFLTLSDMSAGADDKHWFLSSQGGNFYIGTSTDALSATSTYLTINNKGYVGIGTTNPNNLLQVADLINFNNTDYNSLLGYQAGKNIVSGAAFNTFIGYQAGYSDAASTNAAAYNIAVGYRTLYTNTTGSNNAAVGYQALYKNTTGRFNSAIGREALYSNTTGENNLAMGYYTLYSNFSGGSNLAMGNSALYRNQTGAANAVFGTEAGYGIFQNSFSNSALFGYRAGYGLSTGSNNILLGYQAGDNLATGASNIVIGYNIDAPAIDSANTLNIGNLIFGTGINGTGTTLSSGNIGIGTSSPYAKLSVWGSGTSGLTKVFEAVDSASTTLFAILDNGNIGIASSSPFTKLGVIGNAYIQGNLTTTGTVTLNGLTYIFPSSQTASQYLMTNGSGGLSWATIADSGTLNYGGIGSLTYYPSSGRTATGTTNSLLTWDDTNARLGIGTTSPYSKLTVWGSGNLLELVNTASTTVFAVDTAGNITNATWAGNIIGAAYGGTGVNSSGWTEGIAQIINGTWSASTSLSTKYGGTGQDFSASTGFMYLSNGIASASSTIYIGNTDLIAGTGLTLTSNTLNLDEFTMGTTDTNATAGSVFFAGTSGALQQDNLNLFWDDTNNRLGIGTSTPQAALHIGTASSTNLTTYGDSVFISGELEVGGTAYLGPMEFGADSGVISWIDMPVTSAASIGTPESYTARLDGTDLLTIYAESDGAGGIQYAGVGIGSSTPFGVLSVQASSTRPALFVTQVDSGNQGPLAVFYDGGTEKMRLDSAGYLGIGSSSPSQALSVSGNVYITGTTNLNNIAYTWPSSQTANYYLKTDGSGALTWVDVTSTTGTLNYGGIGSLTYYPSSGRTATGTTNSLLTWDDANARLGIGTTSPYSILSISNSASTAINTPLFTIASTTAGVSTSTLFTVLANGNVGIGTVSPNNLLQVADLINFDNTDYNSLLGYQAGKNVVSGAQYNTFLGYQAGYASSTASTNAADNNTAIGYKTLYSNTTGGYNSAMGYFSLYSNTTGLNNSAMGYASLLFNTTGSANTVMGTEAGYGVNANSFANSTLIGYRAGYGLTTGSNNILIGYQAGDSITSASSNTIIGYQAGQAITTTVTRSTFLGYQAGYLNTTGVDNTLMGYTAGDSLTTGGYNTLIGSYAGQATVSGARNTMLGYQAGYLNTVSDNTFIGYQAGDSVTSGTYNTLVGVSSGQAITTGGYNTALGGQSLMLTTGSSNSVMGYQALYSNTTGYYNIGLGFRSLLNNETGYANTVIGTEAGYGVTGNSFVSSTLVGYRAGYALRTGGDNNILLGYQAGDNLTTGASNIIIGYGIDAPLATSANTLNIGNLLFGTGIDGTGTTLSTGNIGIGTTSPYAKLSVWGNGTSGLTAFNVVNSASSTLFTVLDNGFVGIGTANPSYNLEVNGTVSFGSDTAGDIIFDTTTITNPVLIGIGTSTPDADLTIVSDQVNANTYLFTIATSTSGSDVIDRKFVVDSDGDIFYDGTANTPAADYAEYFWTRDTDLQSGEVVCVDVTRDNAVKRCENGADGNVMGIVSTKPAIIGNAKPEYNANTANGYANTTNTNNANYVIVGLLGQVSAKVSTENGPIRPGDSLTSASSTPGYAMRAEAGDSTVGVALEGFGQEDTRYKIQDTNNNQETNSNIQTGVINVLISRRNKSLTVETVEEQITKRIADMEIEDEVNILIANAVNSLNLDEEIAGVLDPKLFLLSTQLTAKTNDLTGKIENIEDVIFNIQYSIFNQFSIFNDKLLEITNNQDTITKQISIINDQLAKLPVLSTSTAFYITKDGYLKMGNAVATTTPEVAVVEIGADSDLPAFVINQAGEGDVADFRADGVSIVNIGESGKVTIIGELLVDGRIMVCSGGACGAALDNAVDETMGDMGVEGTIVAGAFAGYCEDGFMWVPGSAKYGTLPGFCVQAGKYRTDDGTNGNNPPNPPYEGGQYRTNISQGEAQLTCQALGSGYHLLSENEWMTIAENVIRVAENDVDLETEGMQLATTTDDGINGTIPPNPPYEGGRLGTNYILTNGNIIYGLVGGMGEWTDQTVTKTGVFAPANNEWQEYYDITDYKGFNIAPPYYYTSENGIGKIKTGDNENALRGFVRGYDGIFSLDLSNSPATASSTVGFRCAR